MSSVSKHSAIFILAYFLTAFLNYAFGVGLSWFFTPAQFGILGVAQSLLLLLALAVGSGFTWTAANDFAAEGVTEETKQRYRTALVANAILGALLAVALWLTYRSGILDLGPGYQWIIPLIGVNLVLLSIRSVVNGAARGLYLFSPVAQNLILEVIAKVVLGLALVWAGFGAPGVILAFAFGAGLSLAHSLWITRSANLFHGRWVIARRVLVETAPLFIGMLGPALMLNLDILGLKLLAPANGDALAGLYQAAAILARTPVFIAQALTVVLFSYASSKKTPRKESTGQGVNYAETAIKAWLRLLLPVGVALVIAPHAFLNLLFPSAYREASFALQIAGFGGAFLALSTLLIGVFQAEGQRRQPALASAAAVIAQITVLVFTVPLLGTTGAALSLSAAGLVSFALLLPLLKPHSVRSISWKSSLPLLVFTVALLLLPDGDRMLSFLKLAIAGSLYLLALSWVYPERSKAAGEKVSPSALRFFNHFVQVLLGERS